MVLRAFHIIYLVNSVNYAIVRVHNSRSFVLINHKTSLSSGGPVPGGGGDGTPHMNGVGMLVVSLRGLNFGVWSHLGCSGQNAMIFSGR